MANLTSSEIDKGFHIWSHKYGYKDANQLLEPFLNTQIAATTGYGMGWLKMAREALLLSAESVATKLNVSRAAYSKYEECENRGAITLATLAAAAEAMDCELVYAIRPKNRKSFAVQIWEKLLPKTSTHIFLKTCDPKRRGEALAHQTEKTMKDPSFRKKMGWSQRG